ncbi:MAG: hypothetical protein ONB05_01055, partial [candidate division KSB1 bacterium]|nr:hypothetical protein [candidate division KSB1 bacterium]
PILADDIIRAGNFVAAGLPSKSHGTGDVVADDDLVADDALEIGGAASVASNVNSISGYITTGTPDSPGGLSAGDISSTDDVLADDIIRAGNFVAAGLPSMSHSTGDVVADDDLVADDDVEVGDDIIADYIFATRGSGSAVRATYYICSGNIGGVSIPEGYTTGDLLAEDDVLAHDDILGLGTKSAVLQTASFGARRMYTDESAGVYFFDRGEARLVNGEVTVHLDPIFAETVTIDRDNPLLVQITLNADCKGVYVAERTATHFIVRELGGGTSNASFSWEAAAKRRGYEATRLEAIPALGVTAIPEPDAEGASLYSQDQPNGPEVKDVVAKPEEEPAPASNDR